MCALIVNFWIVSTVRIYSHLFCDVLSFKCEADDDNDDKKLS